MKTATEDVRKKFMEKGLKITPQRIIILEAIYTLENHPTAENILEYVRKTHPNIAIGTVYNVLETLVEHGLIRKAKTVEDVMRYDGVMKNHHHLYCSRCDLIEDYEDEELDELLKNHFKNKIISGFEIEDVVLQIRGTFDKC